MPSRRLLPVFAAIAALFVTAGCYSPNKVQLTPQLPAVKVAVVRPPVSSTHGGTQLLSDNALERFYERLQLQLTLEHKYEYVEVSPPNAAAPRSEIPPWTVEEVDSVLRPVGAQYLFVPILLTAKDLAIGGRMTTDAFVFERGNPAVYWRASGAAKGVDPAGFATTGPLNMGVEVLAGAITDPNAFARNTAMELLRTFPAHLRLRAAVDAGVSLPYVDRKGVAIPRIDAPDLRLLDDIHLGKGDGLFNKLVVPAQVLIPFKKDRLGVHYSARLTYLWNTGAGFGDGRTERWGGLILTDGKDAPGWAWFGTENAKFRIPEGTRFEFLPHRRKTD